VGEQGSDGGKWGQESVFFFINDAIGRLDYLGLSEFTKEELDTLKAGIESLLALYGSRVLFGEKPAAIAVNLALSGVAPSLLKDRPISLEYFLHFLSAQGTPKSLDPITYFGDEKIKELLIREYQIKAKTAIVLYNELGRLVDNVSGEINGDQTYPKCLDLLTAVGRASIQYKIKTDCVKTQQGMRVGVVGVVWIDDTYKFIKDFFALDESLPKIPTKEILGFLVQQKQASEFQVQSKVYAESAGANEAEVKQNFQLYNDKPNDNYPDYTFQK
jgi:hypothetical protein